MLYFIHQVHNSITIIIRGTVFMQPMLLIQVPIFQPYQLCMSDIISISIIQLFNYSIIQLFNSSSNFSLVLLSTTNLTSVYINLTNHHSQQYNIFQLPTCPKFTKAKIPSPSPNRQSVTSILTRPNTASAPPTHVQTPPTF